MRYKYTILTNNNISRVQYSSISEKEYVFTKDGVLEQVRRNSYQKYKLPLSGKRMSDYIVEHTSDGSLLFIPETSPLFNIDFLSFRWDYSKEFTERLHSQSIQDVLIYIRKQIKKELGV